MPPAGRAAPGSPPAPGPGVVDHERCLVERQLLDCEAAIGGVQGDTAPEEIPYTYAEPPASSISAWRSSTSRSTANGAVSPLSPRPRRSSVNTVKCCRSSSARGPLGPDAR